MPSTQEVRGRPMHSLLLQRLSSATVLSFTLWLSSFAATPPDTAFSTVTFGLEGVAPLGDFGFAPEWAARPGIGVLAAFPFYAGAVRGGARIASFEAESNRVASFSGRHLYVGWTVRQHWWGRNTFELGGQIGLLQMKFDDPDVHPNQQLEQEVQVEIVAALGRQVASGWGVFVSASYGALLLSAPAHPAYVALGVRRHFRTPRRLREVLR